MTFCEGWDSLKQGAGQFFNRDNINASLNMAEENLGKGIKDFAVEGIIGQDNYDAITDGEWNLQDAEAGAFIILNTATGGRSKAGKAVLKGSGKAGNLLENIRYTDKVKSQMTKGDYHSFPKSVDAFGGNENVTRITGGDGIVRTKVEVPGSYQGKDGVFEYIIEPDGTCNHRLFKPF